MATHSSLLNLCNFCAHTHFLHGEYFKQRIFEKIIDTPKIAYFLFSITTTETMCRTE